MARKLRCTLSWLFTFQAFVFLASIVAGDGPFHDPPPKSSQVITFVSPVSGPSGTSLIEIPVTQPTPDSTLSLITTTYEVSVVTDRTVIPTQQTSSTSTPITIPLAQSVSPTSLKNSIITTQVSPSSSPSSISITQQDSPILTDDGVTTTVDPMTTINPNPVITPSRGPVTTTAEHSDTMAKATTPGTSTLTLPSGGSEHNSSDSNPIPGGPPGTGSSPPVAPIAPIAPLIPPIIPDGLPITVDSSGSSRGLGNGSNEESTATNDDTKTSTTATSKTSRSSESTKTRTTFTLSFIPPPSSSSSILTFSSSMPSFPSFGTSFGPAVGPSSTILSISSVGPSRNFGVSTTLSKFSNSFLAVGPENRSTGSNAHPVITGLPHSNLGIVLPGSVPNSAEPHSISGGQTHKTTPAVPTESTRTVPMPKSQRSDRAHQSSTPESLPSAPAQQSQPRSSRQVWSAPAPSSVAAPASSAPPSNPSGAASAPAASYSGGLDKRTNHDRYKAKKKALPITATFSTRFVAHTPRTPEFGAAPEPVMTVGRYEHIAYDVCVVRGRGCRL